MIRDHWADEDRDDDEDTIMSTQKYDFIHALHTSRDHANDGEPINGPTCNCIQYVNIIWPQIQDAEAVAFQAGWDAYDRSLTKGMSEVALATNKLFYEALNTLTFWRRWGKPRTLPDDHGATRPS